MNTRKNLTRKERVALGHGEYATWTGEQRVQWLRDRAEMADRQVLAMGPEWATEAAECRAMADAMAKTPNPRER